MRDMYPSARTRAQAAVNRTTAGQKERQKELYLVVGDLSTAWASTGYGGSGITAATVFSVTPAPAIPADIATTANAQATQAALNNWATQVGCGDPVFPLATDGIYGTNTQEACALFQGFANDSAGGNASPALTIDGLAGTQTWQYLSTFGAPPASTSTTTTTSTGTATTTSGTTTAPTSSGLSTTAMVAIGCGVGAVGLGGLWWLSKLSKAKRRR